jgi:hypothetical protein
MAKYMNGQLNKYKKAGLLFFSAICFILPFFWPIYFSWCVFIFLTFLFYGIIKNIFNFYHGFVWGLIIYFFNMLALFDCVRCYGVGGLRLVAPLMLVIYFAVYAGIWFYCMCRICNKSRHWAMQLFGLVAPTFVYVWFMYEGSFWIFESWYGYCFTLPLLPLAQRPEWFVFLPYVGIWALLICLIVMQASVILFLIIQKKIMLFFVMVSLTPFVLGWFMIPSAQELNAWPDRVAIINELDATIANPWAKALEINQKIEILIAHNNDIRVVILPESAFPFVLNECERSLEIWKHNCLRANIHVLIGAYRKENEKLYNCLFHMYQGRIINYYDKIHPFFFTEYTTFKNPLWRFLNKQFWKTDFSRACGTCPPPIIDCGDQFSCVPQICSDLFLGHVQAAVFTDMPIVCIVNDRWFRLAYAKRLMRLYVQFTGMACGKRVLYVGYG